MVLKLLPLMSCVGHVASVARDAPSHVDNKLYKIISMAHGGHTDRHTDRETDRPSGLSPFSEEGVGGGMTNRVVGQSLVACGSVQHFQESQRCKAGHKNYLLLNVALNMLPRVDTETKNEQQQQQQQQQRQLQRQLWQNAYNVTLGSVFPASLQFSTSCSALRRPARREREETNNGEREREREEGRETGCNWRAVCLEGISWTIFCLFFILFLHFFLFFLYIA